MRLITRFELATKTATELKVLHKEVFNWIVNTKPCSAEQIAAKKSLENIEIEMTLRAPCP
ncbi:hypothetical protein [Aliikangiella maris]|uniref:Uncharacterized protein n=2 Tax=Aliikangiella maris TaxID=3162458 RepID=A0ABV3MHT8_9GAMM